MHVLVTCLNYPYPLENGENLRIFHYVRTLRDRHSFDLVCLSNKPPPEPIRGLFRRIMPVDAVRQGPPVTGLRRLSAPFSLEHFAPSIPALHDTLAAAMAQSHYDLLWTSGDMFPSIPDCALPILGDIVDDLVVQYTAGLKAMKPGLSYLRMLKYAWLARRYEQRYFPRAAACLYVSEKDAAVFRQICPGTPVHVIHNGVDANYFQPSDLPVEDDTVIFEGSMDFFPNIDGSVYFCTEVLPLIQQKRPGVKVLLVGKKPSERVRALASDQVQVTGFVDDVRPYLARAAVFVSPTRVGAGIKNKILQAWGMAKPVVATPISTGGLRCAEGDNILIRESPQSIADAVVEVLADRSRREALDARGRQTIVDHYTWEAKGRELETLMLNLCAHRAGEVLHA